MHNLTAQPGGSAARSLTLPCLNGARRSLRVIPFLVFSAWVGWAGGAYAQTAAPAPQPSPSQSSPSQPSPSQSSPSAPPELLQTLNQIDAAASKGDLQTVLSFFSPQFTNSDGLNYASLQEQLKQLWQVYPHLVYKTQLNSWNQDGNAIVAETTTTITGQRMDGGREFALNATITSRQRLENQKIVQQEIVNEKSQLTSGAHPPTLHINLPDQLAAGQPFEFDAIVSEPLGNRLLLGAALDEPVQGNSYLSTSPVDMELLPAGGLFKTGRAALTPDRRWVSAVIVRDDGIASVTQRLTVTPKEGSSNR